MKIDWLPFSASALVAGATALAVASLLMPSTGSDSAESFALVQQQDERWLVVAGLYFLASVALTVGLPAILTLMDRHTTRLGLIAVGVFAIGCIGTAGFAMLLAFFRALVKTESIRAGSVDQLTQDAGLGAFLFGWVGAFYLGELLLAAALWRCREAIPRWIPGLLLLHVATLPLGPVLPEVVTTASVLLITVAFAAIGITANNRHVVARA